VCVVFRHHPIEGQLLVTQKDLLVLTRGHLEKLYSPTLSSLPQFMADEARPDWSSASYASTLTAPEVETKGGKHWSTEESLLDAWVFSRHVLSLYD
jgi:hypothetical protein